MALRIALVYALVAGLWIVVSDELAGLLSPSVASLPMTQIYKGGLFVVVTALLLYILIRNLFFRAVSESPVPPQVDVVAPKVDGLHGWIPFLAFTLLALATGAIGYYTFDHYRREIQVERQQALSAIADLKVSQVGAWLAERRSDGEVLKNAAFFAEAAERWLRGGAKDAAIRKKLLERMRAERDFYGYSKLVIFDNAGKDWLTSGEEGEPIPEHERIFARQAAQSREILFSDFHRGTPETGEKIELDMLVPLLISEGGNKRVVGVMYFRIDPRRHLYPMIQSMPIPSETGESLLVRGEGDEVVYLNELRHRHDTALKFRLSLADDKLPAAMVMRGIEGMVRGVDYRGEPVLASVHRIAGTSWGLIVKMDEAEIFAPIHRLATLVIASALIFITLSGTMVALWWRQQRAAFAANQYRLELARQKSETDYRALFDSMLNGFSLCEIIVDDAGIPCDFRYLEINPAFERLTGLRRDAVVGKRVREVMPGIEPVWIETYGRVALNGESARFQDYVADLGIYFDVMAFSPEKGRFATIFDNVTERRLAEQKIARLTSLYAALSQTNQAIVRIGERDALFREICRVAVESGGFKFAWIGLPNEENGKVRVEANYGDDQGYLADLEVTIDPNVPQGRGPTGTAIREGKPYIVNDYVADANTAPWRAALSDRGIRAAAAFPLKQGWASIGALTLYATEIGYFDGKMIDLLTEMMQDISFALDNFEQKKIQATLERQMFWGGRVDNALAEVSDIILSTDMSVDSVSEIILAWTQALTESAIGFVGYMEPKSGHLVVPTMTSEVKDECQVADKRIVFERWDGLFGWVIDHGEAVLVNDVAADARSTGVPPGHPAIHSFLCVPALVEGGLAGIIALANAARDYSKQDLLMVERFAAFYAVALTRQWNAEKLQHSLKTQKALLDNIPDMAWLKDGESHFIAGNEPCAKACGVSPEQLAGKSEFDFFPPDMAERHVADDREVMASGQRKRIEEPLLTSDGKRLWIETIKSPIFDSAGQVIGNVGIARDITERKESERKILRLTRFYDTLSHTNEAIVRIAGLEELLAAVCRIAVVHGQFEAAALRRMQPDTGEVESLAYFGLDDAELKVVRFSSDPSVSLGQVPTAVVLRTGKHYICNDVFGDPAAQPRRELFKRLGIGAVGVFPIFRDGRVYCALTLYAGESGFFDENLVELLQEMAMDISFALDNFAREESRMQAVEALQESEVRFRTIFDSVNDAIFVHDLVTGAILDVNRRMCEMYGYSREEALQLGVGALSSGVPPYDQEGALQWIGKAVHGEPQTFEWHSRNRDGRLFWVEVNMRRASIGGLERLLVSVRDIGERKLAEEKLRLDALVFESSSEGMVITDAENRYIGVNRAFTEITGYTLEEVLGQNPRILHSGRQDADFYRKMWGDIQSIGHWQGELWNRRKNGEVYPEWLNITVVRDAAGKTTHHIGTMTDISSRKMAEDEIYHLTRYDVLTGLPNKFLLEYRLTQALGRADELHQHLGVVMVNLDNFHAINDSAGYSSGDQVLVKVAQRLSAAVREEDTVARMGADNFVAVEIYPGNINEFIVKIEKLLVAIAQPVEIEGREIQLNASLGISLYPGDGTTAMDLIQKAGIAMRHAKTEGGNNYSFFAHEMNTHALAEMALSNDLRHAQERGELRLHYQTQVDTFSGEIVGVEALLRWQHPELGLLMPSEFIALAEENGLIVPIGDWVLREACRQMKVWHEAGNSQLFISVNVSALQFKQVSLAQTVIKAIRESGLEAGSVELEMTEGMIMSHFEQTRATLTALKAFGVRFSIDDFGTGYSSLNYLKHFPIDKLKIDISFITDIAIDSDNAAIVRAMIAMGHSLQMKVIAEGVESEAQAGYLRTIHCDEMQGYYFSRPLPAEEVSALLGMRQSVRASVEEEYERVLLLVDDEANVISALKRVLRRDGYRILTAGSAQEGLELLAKHPVGVIISDQRMPNMTGIEFLSKVKVMYPDIVRMVLSGYTEVNTMTEAINRGAIYKFLTKPWEDEPLRETIKEAFLRYETDKDEA
ncbi:MAG: EAL domain-containing protein [Betaproteobacteria bacterium]|nr:EAL domain-containing protein [Betaproteobacteria bacterium]